MTATLLTVALALIFDGLLRLLERLVTLGPCQRRSLMDGVMSVWQWLTDPAHWTGPDGIPIRTLQTLYISAVAMIIAIASHSRSA